MPVSTRGRDAKGRGVATMFAKNRPGYASQADTYREALWSKPTVPTVPATLLTPRHSSCANMAADPR